VANDNNVVARGTAKSTTVTNLLLDVGQNGTFRNRAERENVTDVQGSLLTSVDELTSVDALVSNEGLLTLLVLVGVTENDLGKGSTTARVVDDLLDNTTNVTVSLSVVERTELGGALSQAGVSLEDGTGTLSLVANNSS
jgi:hypothetical protein